MSVDATLMRSCSFLFLFRALAQTEDEVQRTLIESQILSLIGDLGDAASSVADPGTERGEIRPIDVDHTAYCVVAPLLFTLLWQHSLGPFDDRPFDAAAVVRAHIDLLLRGLAVEGAAGAKAKRASSRSATRPKTGPKNHKRNRRERSDR